MQFSPLYLSSKIPKIFPPSLLFKTPNSPIRLGTLSLNLQVFWRSGEHSDGFFFSSSFSWFVHYLLTLFLSLFFFSFSSSSNPSTSSISFNFLFFPTNTKSYTTTFSSFLLSFKDSTFLPSFLVFFTFSLYFFFSPFLLFF
ncbi:hypothetical protein M9H77_06875 [Catharanthus roseus]|uniref:Uncharacterized protein n=1 Tax=Catharanthus roseus TaxID=4058 RepID=A0ACC0BTD4_CATRO|nr:hypothetical protein M9H77_06875 [Catharanthus roseus]